MKKFDRCTFGAPCTDAPMQQCIYANMNLCNHAHICKWTGIEKHEKIWQMHFWCNMHQCTDATVHLCEHAFMQPCTHTQMNLNRITRKIWHMHFWCTMHRCADATTHLYEHAFMQLCTYMQMNLNRKTWKNVTHALLVHYAPVHRCTDTLTAPKRIE